MTLSERSEFGIFRDKRTGMKASSSYSTRSSFREFLCALSLRLKKVWEHPKHIQTCKQYQLINKTLCIIAPKTTDIRTKCSDIEGFQLKQTS